MSRMALVAVLVGCACAPRLEPTVPPPEQPSPVASSSVATAAEASPFRADDPLLDDDPPPGAHMPSGFRPGGPPGSPRADVAFNMVQGKLPGGAQGVRFAGKGTEIAVEFYDDEFQYIVAGRAAEYDGVRLISWEHGGEYQYRTLRVYRLLESGQLERQPLGDERQETVASVEGTPGVLRKHYTFEDDFDLKLDKRRGCYRVHYDAEGDEHEPIGVAIYRWPNLVASHVNPEHELNGAGVMVSHPSGTAEFIWAEYPDAVVQTAGLERSDSPYGEE